MSQLVVGGAGDDSRFQAINGFQINGCTQCARRKYVGINIVDFFRTADIDTKFINAALQCCGVDIGDGDGIVKAVRAKYLQNDLFVITLNEGKKRQIRRMFGVLGTRVIDLRRTRISTLTLPFPLA